MKRITAIIVLAVSFFCFEQADAQTISSLSSYNTGIVPTTINGPLTNTITNTGINNSNSIKLPDANSTYGTHTNGINPNTPILPGAGTSMPLLPGNGVKAAGNNGSAINVPGNNATHFTTGNQ
ncbi:MAG TPA: hypothetical protein VGC01_11460 [Mucilaginibacter sp.]